MTSLSDTALRHLSFMALRTWTLESTKLKPGTRWVECIQRTLSLYSVSLLFIMTGCFRPAKAELFSTQLQILSPQPLSTLSFDVG